MLAFARRAKVAIAVILLSAACSQPPPKPTPPPAPTGPVRVGVVGLIAEVKERGINQGNVREYFGKLFSTDSDHNVLKIQYEVTVLYDDGTSGTVTVDERPDFQPGQKVRVQGTKIEPVRR
jgi:hypothetical protein